jgi:hypothetical protein
MKCIDCMSFIYRAFLLVRMQRCWAFDETNLDITVRCELAPFLGTKRLPI